MPHPADHRPSRSTAGAQRGETNWRIHITSVFVDNQDKTLRFYTERLGFERKNDVPIGDARWLTVVSPQQPDGPEPLLEPDGHRAVRPYKEALFADGIPAASFAVTDVGAEVERPRAVGVTFVQEPTLMGPVTTAVLDDTCGNLIQLVAPE
ncbi:Catechol 2,3-dioxygenase [Actinopolyspora xinjiangensis]|uniref:Catechol 2,3-dioxygenase n=1 Tax=Actinopolyspora xinjiangensis TaxID=405564 RepID=A0A1H0NXI9_9ACTN|nr:VOC family protein [Actinopolyspora xinjiangensis]SDO97492.1 Catechol 2,3-dioxygenase [Actinopolyspora xinjiangensis]